VEKRRKECSPLFAAATRREKKRGLDTTTLRPSEEPTQHRRQHLHPHSNPVVYYASPHPIRKLSPSQRSNLCSTASSARSMTSIRWYSDQPWITTNRLYTRCDLYIPLRRTVRMRRALTSMCPGRLRRTTTPASQRLVCTEGSWARVTGQLFDLIVWHVLCSGDGKESFSEVVIDIVPVVEAWHCGPDEAVLVCLDGMRGLWDSGGVTWWC
jgi:hypothetical protein